jgi:hypothetical protein
VQPSRRLVHEGEVKRIGAQAASPMCYLFLFNDILVITERRRVRHCPPVVCRVLRVCGRMLRVVSCRGELTVEGTVMFEEKYYYTFKEQVWAGTDRKLRAIMPPTPRRTPGDEDKSDPPLLVLSARSLRPTLHDRLAPFSSS